MIKLKKFDTTLELVTYVRDFMLQQGRRAIVETDRKQCAYKTEDDCKCAIGCLMDGYDPMIENKSLAYLFNAGYVEKNVNYSVLQRLQYLHDGYEFDQMIRNYNTWISNLTPPEKSSKDKFHDSLKIV